MRRPEDVQPLSQLVLLLPYDLILYEQKRKERSDEIVKGSNGGNDIIVINILILTDWKLSMTVVDLLHSVLDMRVLDVAENGVIDQQLGKGIFLL